MSVNNEQFRLLFIDHKFGEMALEVQLSTYNPDAVLMVMAVDDEESLATAAGMLSLMKRTEVLDKLPVILVANKTDLVRSRSIKHSDGKCLARQFNVKYIETSPGKYTINIHPAILYLTSSLSVIFIISQTFPSPLKLST